MTEAIYLEVTEMAETAHKAKRRVSVSGMLKHLGVSRSGYHAWLKRVPSNTEKRREAVKAKIQDIYDESKQNYGAPKITKELRKSGEIISERTVGKYMKQMGIKAQWVKPWTITTKDSDFSSELKNILDEQFNPERPNAVWCSDITYIWTLIFSTNEPFRRKDTHGLGEHACGCTGGGGREWDGLGIGGQWMQPIAFAMNKHGDPAV